MNMVGNITIRYRNTWHRKYFPNIFQYRSEYRDSYLLFGIACTLPILFIFAILDANEFAMLICIISRPFR